MPVGSVAMKNGPPEPRYVRPPTLEEALAHISEERAVIIAGGQTLLPRLGTGAVSAGKLVDLGGLKELQRIEVEEGRVTVGAMVRLAQAEHSPALRSRVPLLADCVQKTATRAIRNLATLVGNLASADPASQLPVVALALDAIFRLESLGGVRHVPAEEFFAGPNQTVVRPDEIITHVVFEDAFGAGGGFSFVPLRRNSRALATAAVTIRAGGSGNLDRVAIAVGGCGDIPRRCHGVETRLTGLSTGVAPDAAAESLIAEPPPKGAGVLDADYAVQVLPALLRRAMHQACSAVHRQANVDPRISA